MVPRLRRFCYVIMCVCVLDVTSSLEAGSRLLPHYARRRSKAGVNEAPLIQTIQSAEPRCGHYSCLSSADPEIDLVLDDASFSSEIHGGDSSETSSTMQTNTTSQSSSKEWHRKDQTSSTDRSRSGLDQPTPRQSHSNPPPDRGDRTIQVSPYLCC